MEAERGGGGEEEEVTQWFADFSRSELLWLTGELQPALTPHTPPHPYTHTNTRLSFSVSRVLQIENKLTKTQDKFDTYIYFFLI